MEDNNKEKEDVRIQSTVDPDKKLSEEEWKEHIKKERQKGLTNDTQTGLDLE